MLIFLITLCNPRYSLKLQTPSACYCRAEWAMSVQLIAQPAVGLVDDRVHVLVTELVAQQSVTLVALLTESEMTFLSVGQYVSDDEGRVDLQTASSVGGTYTGQNSAMLCNSISILIWLNLIPRTREILKRNATHSTCEDPTSVVRETSELRLSVAEKLCCV